MSSWDAWIGREDVLADRVDEGLAARWLATLDRSPCADGTVPQGLHWCLCLPDAPTARLGPDGHPLRDEQGFLPPIPLPRRMWASSRVTFHKPLRAGEAIERTSRVMSVADKHGSSGHLTFVEIAHETRSGTELLVSEVQTVVYREAAPAGARLVPPPPSDTRFDPAGWRAHRMLVPTEPLLLRFSALTFNAHRIHYDRPYAELEEGYRGLVVHGPLTATLLLQLAAQQLGDNALASFAFRGTSPAICGEALHLAMRDGEAGIDMGAFAVDGREVMRANATVLG